jgi:hypothetical protein
MLHNQFWRVDAVQGGLKRLVCFVEVCQIAELGVEVHSWLNIKIKMTSKRTDMRDGFLTYEDTEKVSSSY